MVAIGHITSSNAINIISKKNTKYSQKYNNKNNNNMVASAIFITDLTGKPLISRNYRGDIPLTSAIEKFTSYLLEVDDELKKPVFYVDSNGDFLGSDDVGCTGVGGETFVYVKVSTVLVFAILHLCIFIRGVCVCILFVWWMGREKVRWG